jgi:3-phenylpropionate/cinnamic acid dioxygenase small subunit
MPVSYETEQAVRSTLHQYCEAIDTADLEGFAALYEHGHWFLVPEPGAKPVFDWLSKYTILYDGKTFTRHELSNLQVEGSDSADEVTFKCYLTIWQDLPGKEPLLVAHVRFYGSFRQLDGKWWLNTHSAESDYQGDFSGHVREGGHAYVTGDEHAEQ